MSISVSACSDDSPCPLRDAPRPPPFLGIQAAGGDGTGPGDRHRGEGPVPTKVLRRRRKRAHHHVRNVVGVLRAAEQLHDVLRDRVSAKRPRGTSSRHDDENAGDRPSASRTGEYPYVQWTSSMRPFRGSDQGVRVERRLSPAHSLDFSPIDRQFQPNAQTSLAHGRRMPADAEARRVAVVVELPEIAPPPKEHRLMRVEHHRDQALQALRPGVDEPPKSRSSRPCGSARALAAAAPSQVQEQ